ncbi:hypothetical protein MLD38_015861 [Melastoma candidum]|uniref:Uncharacterized protein n=1 Tax=Melastoma candidum TaxID=119954 RepID=A0ACB9RH52_9MYRT|nr:hypothetical protein MLD38_015861 [Melastoma candidum]
MREHYYTSSSITRSGISGAMPKDIVGDLVETIAENITKQSASFLQQEKPQDVAAQFNKLFNRQKPIHHILGGGKSADLLLWRNKKASGGALTGATVTWILFEWLNYHFLTLVCVALILGMTVQFLWLNASGLLKRSPSDVPRIVLPKELFVNVAVSAGYYLNQALGFLQDVALGGNLKQFLMVVGCLFAAAVISTWFNFITVFFIGFVAAHTLPVLYERNEDKVDGIINQALGQLQHHYKKLDAGLLSRIPKGKLKTKKHD